uniref:NADH-ubiquinone oxidoreductase chain 4 n=1 Tax=Neomikiella lychnidis TaxID=2719079 RepID=A0A7L7S2R2_9DIPT|nr:NADH dehydrogenase subunit 4 [Neomikiella lychnidis]
MNKIIFMIIIFFFNMNFWDYMYLFIFSFLCISIFYYPFMYMMFFNSMFFIDKINFWLIILTMWIIFLMILSMFIFKINNNNIMLFIFFITMLSVFLILSFSINNYLMFYIFFEMSLIPTLYLILGWGYQPERLMAGIYLLFYTLFASMPLLMGLLFLKKKLNLIQLFYNSMKIFNIFLFYSLNFAFLVKMPMFLVHLWLPKAHVEAPISGSMILAAILLKLGGYGLIRIIKITMLFKNLNFLFMLISIYGGILISFNCLRQFDLKILIAFSSVAHMGLVLGGLFTIFMWGINGSFFMMIAHGLCSSGLFCLANISYERLLSRSMLINKGMINFMPSLSFWWFLLITNNMSSPISLNLIAEISLINSIISFSLLFMYMIFVLCFFSASYCYYLYSFSQHGSFYSSIYSFSNSSIREMLLLMFHWFPLNLLFLKMLIL